MAPLASSLAGPALTETQSMISEGAAAMKDEVERLAKKVDQLDKRSKLMLKVLVIGLGLDLAADFLPVSIHE